MVLEMIWQGMDAHILKEGRARNDNNLMMR